MKMVVGEDLVNLNSNRIEKIMKNSIKNWKCFTKIQSIHRKEDKIKLISDTIL
jgi:hypothetical protein